VVANRQVDKIRRLALRVAGAEQLGQEDLAGVAGGDGRGGAADLVALAARNVAADQLVAEAEEAHGKAQSLVRSALLNMASLLRQPAHRSFLEQAKQERFITEVLRGKGNGKNQSTSLGGTEGQPCRRRSQAAGTDGTGQCTIPEAG